MSVSSLRADGWQDVAALVVMATVAVFFWYTHDLYLNWLVLVAGIAAGLVVNVVSDFAADRPVAGFLPAMLFVVVTTAAIMIKSLAAGVVAALTVATAIKVHEVYLQ
ncbi:MULTISPECIES: hypothetical protein [Halorussus]|uniref:hypothetical protein n=1 Tax=Halorussus TaxID=1070314 RepID=UPI00209E741D|nr:hypothetical protein [Halorussus vallis]USZ78131.1 hypothetical protein NGM07_20960 [Halorussus vallis]